MQEFFKLKALAFYLEPHDHCDWHISRRYYECKHHWFLCGNALHVKKASRFLRLCCSDVLKTFVITYIYTNLC